MYACSLKVRNILIGFCFCLLVDCASTDSPDASVDKVKKDVGSTGNHGRGIFGNLGQRQDRFVALRDAAPDQKESQELSDDDSGTMLSRTGRILLIVLAPLGGVICLVVLVYVYKDVIKEFFMSPVCVSEPRFWAMQDLGNSTTVPPPSCPENERVIGPALTGISFRDLRIEVNSNEELFQPKVPSNRRASEDNTDPALGEKNPVKKAISALCGLSPLQHTEPSSPTIVSKPPPHNPSSRTSLAGSESVGTNPQTAYPSSGNSPTAMPGLVEWIRSVQDPSQGASAAGGVSASLGTMRMPSNTPRNLLHAMNMSDFPVRDRSSWTVVEEMGTIGEAESERERNWSWSSGNLRQISRNYSGMDRMQSGGLGTAEGPSPTETTQATPKAERPGMIRQLSQSLRLSRARRGPGDEDSRSWLEDRFMDPSGAGMFASAEGSPEAASAGRRFMDPSAAGMFASPEGSPQGESDGAASVGRQTGRGGSPEFVRVI